MPGTYPLLADVKQLLRSFGVAFPAASLATADTEIQTALDTATQEWENLSGEHPWLVEGTDSVWYFDPSPKRYMPLRVGYQSITSVEFGISYDQTTSAEIAGTVAVLNRDYALYPYNELPITALMWSPVNVNMALTAAFPGQWQRSVKVTGKRGMRTSIPQEVWNAIRQRAAAIARPQCEEANGWNRTFFKLTQSPAYRIIYL